MTPILEDPPVGLVIAFSGGDDEQVVTQAPAAAGVLATENAPAAGMEH